jgi:hypothetical protein
MKITLLILILIGCLIVSLAGLFRKKYPAYTEEVEDMYKIESDKFMYPENLTDPLWILREDTYSNEEINEMTGRQIREQYKINNL